MNRGSCFISGVDSSVATRPSRAGDSKERYDRSSAAHEARDNEQRVVGQSLLMHARRSFTRATPDQPRSNQGIAPNRSRQPQMGSEVSTPEGLSFVTGMAVTKEDDMPTKQGSGQREFFGALIPLLAPLAKAVLPTLASAAVKAGSGALVVNNGSCSPRRWLPSCSSRSVPAHEPSQLTLKLVVILTRTIDFGSGHLLGHFLTERSNRGTRPSQSRERRHDFHRH
jgi:hypothetical protein